MERRTAIKTMSVVAAAPLGVFEMMQSVLAAANDVDPATLDPPHETKKGDMRYRQLGRTGEEVSLVGVGGFHIGSVNGEGEATKIIRTAIDRGVTFMDNCWDYHDGESERRMGKALQDGYRKKVFLMTKIDGRTKKAAAEQIDESLKRLQTDHVDLMQHHENIRMEDADRIFADGGAMQAFEAAKTAGKIRFIGFTGHKDPAVHLRMLEVADQNGFHFDAVQMPINVMDAHFRSFQRQVLPEALKRGIGVLGMKPLGSGEILQSKTVSATECLQFAMSLPVSVVITGIDSMKILEQALEAVKTFQPLGDDARKAILSTARQKIRSGSVKCDPLRNY